MDSMPDSQFDLTIVVPVFNNSSTLEQLFHRIKNTLENEGVTFELLFVNDAGADNSLEVLFDLYACHYEISIIKLLYNIGQHAAVLHGLRFARGHCCLVMDADLQDPPEALSMLWKSRSSSYQAIFAGRAGSYQNSSRMITSKLYKNLLHWLVGLPRDAGIFVLMERELVDILLNMRVHIPWINVMIGLSNFPVLSVPVKREIREYSESNYSGWGRLYSAIRGVYCALTYKLCPLEESYLKNCKEDPIAWVKQKKIP